MKYSYSEWHVLFRDKKKSGMGSLLRVFSSLLLQSKKSMTSHIIPSDSPTS